MEKQGTDIHIRIPVKEDLEEVWDMMDKIHKKQQELLTYEDFHTEHTKETLGQLIENGNEAERIWIACDDTKIVGLIDIQYKSPDYMFFDDKYVYVRYFYEEEAVTCSEMLMDTAIEDARKYGFTYMCGDVLSEDKDMESLYGKNQFENYRLRLAKNLY